MMSQDLFGSRVSQRWLPVISLIPAIFAIGVVVCQMLRPLRYRLPKWLKGFNQEIEKQQESPNPIINVTLSSRLTPVLGICILTCLCLQATSIFFPVLDLMAIPPAVSLVVALLLILVGGASTTPVGVLAIMTSVFITQLILLLGSRSLFRIHGLPLSLELIVALIVILITLNIPLRNPRLPMDEISRSGEVPVSALRSPEDNLTLWQFMTVTWMWPLISIGKIRQLHDDDVWKLGFEFQHQRLHEHFRELKGSVVRRLLKANGIDLVITASLGVLELLARYSSPVLLQQLLRAMENPLASRSEAITYATLSLLARLISCQSSVFSFWYMRRCYERSRGEMLTMLYEKTLSRKIIGASTDLGTIDNPKMADLNGSQQKKGTSYLTKMYKNAADVAYLFFCCSRRKETPKEAKLPASMGKILNLMRNDVYQISQRFWEFQTIVETPIELVLSTVLVWKLIGWPCFLGVLTVFGAQIINAFITRVLLGWERKKRTATDKKLNQTSEFITAIRHLRWYGWQDFWLTKILESRAEELRLRVIVSLWRNAIELTNFLASCMFPVVAFYAYTKLAGLPLRIDIAFPAIQLFGMLESNLRYIPDLIRTLLDAKISVDRLEDFMNEPNKEEQKLRNDSDTCRMELLDASFAWPGIDALVLENISIKFPTGMTVIYGKVAAGKSALLQAILGELDAKSGNTICPDEMIGYCAQTPWLQSMSIRDNILFSFPYEEARYKRVLESCALITDLASFKDGDLSNIGENGIGLSGGQKARVALARAVYSRAKILLLDDPLSALDHQTAESIVKNCFRGPLLEGRIALLVTHRVELCRSMATQMVEVAGGRARVLDNSEMPSSGDDLQRILSSETTGSISRKDMEDQSTAAVPEKFIEDEHRTHGGVQASVYWVFAKAGKLRNWAILILIITTFRLVTYAKNWFLKAWGEGYGTPSSTMALPQGSGLFGFLPSPEQDINPWLLGFFIISMIRCFITLLKSIFMILIVYTTGKQMFIDVMNKVTSATFRFYDITPVGRLMNRMTSDIGTIDGNISRQFHYVAWGLVMWISSAVVIASITPVFLVFSCALSLAFVYIFRYFLPTSQSLRRLEMVSLSPLMSNFGALLEGLATVRAFHVQSRFQGQLIEVVDTFQKMDHFYWSLQTWLRYRFDALSAISTFILTMLALYTGVSPGLTAFALIAAAQYVNSTHELCTSYGRLQMDFVSVERVVELLQLDQEPKGDIEPPASWPKYTGDIEFQDVTIRYAPHLEPSLSGLSFTIPAGSTTALLGRTGSGKSTLALALLATVKPDKGAIMIDGIDLARVDTQALRTRVVSTTSPSPFSVARSLC